MLPGGGSVSAPIPVSNLRETRTAVRDASGSLFKNHERYTVRQKNLEKVRKMLTEDIYSAYEHHGGKVGRTAIEEADKFWAVNKAFDEKYMSGIAKKTGFTSPLKLYREIESSISGLDTQTIGAIRSRLTPGSDEWAAVVDQYVRDRVITGRGNLDFEAFLKMRDDIGKSTSMEGLIFGKPGGLGRQYWDDLTAYFEDNAGILKRAAGPLTEAKGAGVFSNLAVYGPAMLIGGAGSAFMGGSPVWGAFAAGALAAMTPNAAWTLVKQPRFMNILMKNQTDKIVSFPARLAQIGRIAHGLDEDEQAALVEFMMTAESQIGNYESGQGGQQNPLAAGALGGR
jgi:hypothetical protein